MGRLIEVLDVEQDVVDIPCRQSVLSMIWGRIFKMLSLYHWKLRCRILSAMLFSGDPRCLIRDSWPGSRDLPQSLVGFGLKIRSLIHRVEKDSFFFGSYACDV